ncbi:MAG TPA: hypothetical protein VLI71_02500 [Gammaproteobacteria bacterium]|nr:hypothetical protein [Gammaproteobacteria bacterium]
MFRSVSIAALLAAAGAHAQLDGTVISLEHSAIGYRTQSPDNPVADLQERLTRGTGELSFDARPGIGYLPSVLRELGVPLESQLLVYSKTSLQQGLIEPERPRALYFNDEIAVGAVRDGIIEIAVQDPTQGAVFYTLQRVAEQPRLERQGSCLGCHYAHATLGVPGFFARSIPTAADGRTLPWLGNLTVDHSTPFAERWGGWYVTGDVGSQTHYGNALLPDNRAQALPPLPGGMPQQLPAPLAATYLTPYSDAVAHLVFEHQLEAMNVLTRVGWEYRIAAAEAVSATSLERSIEDAVDYFLFVDEAQIPRVRGTSGFAEAFEALGPHDEKGRSLRQLQLDGRLMRYPLSYMIHSKAFDALPAEARDAFYRRLWAVLSGAVDDSRYAGLSTVDREAIIGILVATKTGLPDYFR